MITRKNHTQTKTYFVQNIGRGNFQANPFIFSHFPLLMHKLGIQNFSIRIKDNYQFTFGKDSPFKVQ